MRTSVYNLRCVNESKPAPSDDRLQPHLRIQLTPLSFSLTSRQAIVMSSTRRHDIVDRANLTDESQTFKKAHQTVDRPPVTERDIHEQYMQDPPHVSF